jgi:redox-sensitive bicupin YhaK (pirin superfamily)
LEGGPDLVATGRDLAFGDREAVCAADEGLAVATIRGLRHLGVAVTVRRVLHRSRPPRLPVWPVAAGVTAWAAERLGLTGWAASIEDRFGGRVTPMSLPPEADPFLMLVHHTHSFSPFDPLRPLSALILPEGFAAHPHRGFETATYVIEGGLRHRDSAGVKMVTGSGSVQWLTAGRGVLHEEMWAPAPRQELYQLWVNLPARHKFDAPRIQLLGEGSVEGGAVDRAPLTVIERPGLRLTLLCGALAEARAATETRSPMAVARAEWSDAATWAWAEVPADHTALLYVRRGSVQVGGELVSAGELAVLAPGRLELAGAAGADAMVMTGEPLREPIARGGSWVMNTAAQVQQADEDWRAGRFGAPWPPSASDAAWRAAIGRSPASGA